MLYTGNTLQIMKGLLLLYLLTNIFPLRVSRTEFPGLTQFTVQIQTKGNKLNTYCSGNFPKIYL